MYYLIVMSRSPSAIRFTRAVVAYANRYQFGPSERIRYSCVQSRMILWCKAGRGEVIINSVSFNLEAGRYLVLPWGHEILYRASPTDPFLLAGIHLIPNHGMKHSLTFEVAHHPGHALADSPFRKDISIFELQGLKTGWLHEHSPTLHLFEYIVGLFIRGAPPDWLARSLAQEVLCELVFLERTRETPQPSLPLELDRMKQYVMVNLHQRLSLRDLVAFSRHSPSTVCRMFRQHLGTTPVTWILHLKMERARLLLRTQRLTVAQVGDRVGISDAYYFSKCFTKAVGRSPHLYRKEMARI